MSSGMKKNVLRDDGTNHINHGSDLYNDQLRRHRMPHTCNIETLRFMEYKLALLILFFPCPNAFIDLEEAPRRAYSMMKQRTCIAFRFANRYAEAGAHERGKAEKQPWPRSN